MFSGLIKSRDLPTSEDSWAVVIPQGTTQTDAFQIKADVNYAPAGLFAQGLRLPPATKIGRHIFVFGQFRNVYASPGDAMFGNSGAATGAAFTTENSPGPDQHAILFVCSTLGRWVSILLPVAGNGFDAYYQGSLATRSTLTVQNVSTLQLGAVIGTDTVIGTGIPLGATVRGATHFAGGTADLPGANLTIATGASKGSGTPPHIITQVAPQGPGGTQLNAAVTVGDLTANALLLSVSQINNGIIESRGTLTAFPTNPPISRGAHPTSVSGPIVSGFNPVSFPGRTSAAGKQSSAFNFGGF